MIIETSSWRLAFAARLCRLFPPGISGPLAWRLYPLSLAERENAAFITRSSLGDLAFRFSRAEYIATYYAIRGYYEWQNVLIANAICRPGDTVIEIGSNIGTETLLYSKIVSSKGKVISFEPMPENFRTLNDLIQLNGLQNIVVHQAAVSDQEATLAFLPPKNSLNSGQGTLTSNAGDEEEHIYVESLVIDRMHETGQLGPARLIVMDVQGAELRVLRGAERFISQYEPYIVLEVESDWLAKHQAAPASILEFMERHGYKAWSISKWGLHKAKGGIDSIGNWLCIPRGNSPESLWCSRRISRRLKLGATMPLIKHLNPAVVTTPNV